MEKKILHLFKKDHENHFFEKETSFYFLSLMTDQKRVKAVKFCIKVATDYSIKPKTLKYTKIKLWSFNFNMIEEGLIPQ